MHQVHAMPFTAVILVHWHANKVQAARDSDDCFAILQMAWSKSMLHMICKQQALMLNMAHRFNTYQSLQQSIPNVSGENECMRHEKHVIFLECPAGFLALHEQQTQLQLLFRSQSLSDGSAVPASPIRSDLTLAIVYR